MSNLNLSSGASDPTIAAVGPSGHELPARFIPGASGHPSGGIIKLNGIVNDKAARPYCDRDTGKLLR